MPKYNDQIELSVKDMELIEGALRESKRALSNQDLSAANSDVKSVEESEDLDETVRQIHDLLSRLHNQKIFYRPQSGAYVGG